MTLVSRIRLTVWADKSITGEVPVGRDQDGNPVWERLSGQAITLVLGTVKGADWQTWAQSVTVDGKPQTVQRYRTVRSWRMTTDERTVGRIDLTEVKREDPPAADVAAALSGAAVVAAPVRRAAQPAQTADLAD